MHILFLVAHPIDDASARYRVHQFVPYLEREGHTCAIWAFSTERLFRCMRTRGHMSTKVLETVKCSIRHLMRLSDLSAFDLVVIHREAFPFLTPLVEKWILLRHAKVIFSFDDAIYAGHDDASGLNHPFLYRIKYGRGVDEVLRRSRHVIAGNRILADHARQFNPRVSIIPTVVDCAQYPARQAKRNGEPLTVGWVGSRSTAPYLAAIEPALRSLADNNRGRIRFRFFGCPEYKPDLPDFESLPFRLESEVSDLQSIDIGIMPLPDTEWTRGKCAFKAIQYMAGGTAAIASPVGITAEIIRHDINGLLAASTEDWLRGLTRLVNEEDLRRRLAKNARRTIEERYSLEVWGPRLVSLLEGLASTALSTWPGPCIEPDYSSDENQFCQHP